MALDFLIPSFLDELEKIAGVVELSPSEQAKEMAQFATLGAIATPIIGMAANKASTGKWMPPNVTFRRYIPTGVATGLVTGGLLPAARLSISRKNLESARERLAVEKEMRSLASTTPSVLSSPKKIERLTKL